MAKKYLKSQPTNKKASQSEPIPGREKEMKQNNAGGYAFKADSFTRLERFLILGSEGGSYYVGERDLTKQNVDNVRACLEVDGQRAVNMITQISVSGRAPKNDPAIYALALAASAEDTKTRAVAMAAVPKVCRIGTHLFSFCEYIETMRGWGPALRKAVSAWYTDKPDDKLAYQLVKYQQRNGWSHRDVLRLAHPKGYNTTLLRWAVQKPLHELEITATKSGRKSKYPATVEEDQDQGYPAIISAYELLKQEAASNKDKTAVERLAVSLISQYGLTHEMIPTEYQKSPVIWEAMLDKGMPMNAMVRSLGRMGSIGLLAPLSAASKKVVAQLGNQELITKSRIHPFALLIALLTYKQGHGTKGSLTWTPVPQITDALDTAFYAAFRSVQPTGKRFYVGVDVSGSMNSEFMGVSGLSASMAAAAMSLLIAKTEPNYFIGGFSTTFKDLGFTAKDSLSAALTRVKTHTFGGTDCAVAIKHALASKYPVDAFVIISDGETWAGDVHASQAIQQYRRSTGIDSKLIVMNMVSNDTRLSDPKDDGSLDCVGFDGSVPLVIRNFIGADISPATEE